MSKTIFKSILYGIVSIVVNSLLVGFGYLTYWIFTVTCATEGLTAVYYGVVTLFTLIVTLGALFLVGASLYMLIDFLEEQFMKFVLLKPWNGDESGAWWQWIPETMKLCNFMGGGFDIDENAEYWITAEIHEFDSWHQLYRKEKFNPLKEDIYYHDVWISPEGEFFNGDAHRVAATYITKLVYGVEFEDTLCYGHAEDYLISHGWVKATSGYMWSIYQSRGTTWKLTQKAFDTLTEYCKLHKQKMPADIDIISSAVAEIGGIYGPDNRNW